MPPPLSSFPRLAILSPAEAVKLAEYRAYIRRRSSQLLYIADGGRFYFLPRHARHPAVVHRRAIRRALAVKVRRDAYLLPREFRRMVHRRIAALRFILLNGARLKDVSLRASLPKHAVSAILLGRKDPRLSTAVRLADALGVKVRTLAAYLRKVRRLRERSLL